MTKNSEKEIRELKKQVKEHKKESFNAKQLAKKATSQVSQEAKKQTTTAIIAAFGFLIALVWRDAIKSYTDTLILKFSIPGPQSLIIFYTAIITTFIAVLGIILLNKWSKKI